MVGTCPHPPLLDQSTDCLFFILNAPNFLLHFRDICEGFLYSLEGIKQWIGPGECYMP